MNDRCETCGFRNCICDMEGSFAPRSTLAHIECKSVDFSATSARQTTSTWSDYLATLDDYLDLALGF